MGDIVAGLQSLRSAFRHKEPNFPWFDYVVVLRRLCAEAPSDETIFRKFRWTLESTSTEPFGSMWDPSRLTFLSHLVLGLGRLVEEGCTQFIQETSFQLLVQFVTSDLPQIQLLAASVIQGFGQSENLRVKETAQVLLLLLERTIFKQTQDSGLQRFAARLKSEREAQAIAVRREDYHGFLSPMGALFRKLDEYGTSQDESNSDPDLLFQAMGVCSKNSSQILHGLQEVLAIDLSTCKYFGQIQEKSSMSPIHRACASGISHNVEWMLKAALDVSPQTCYELMKCKHPKTGQQPIHMAGSLEVFKVLLEFRADLHARSDTNELCLHTVKCLDGLRFVCKKLREEGQLDLEAATSTLRTPLMTTESGEIAEELLLQRAMIDAVTRDSLQTCAFLEACKRGCVDVADVLLTARADVKVTNGDGENCLFGASADILQLLLERGVLDSSLVNAQSKKGCRGRTCIFKSPNCDVTELLVQAAADLTFKDYMGWQPLLVAAAAKKPNCGVDVLLEARADLSTAIDHMQAPAFWLSLLIGHATAVLSILNGVPASEIPGLLQQEIDEGNTVYSAFAERAGTEMLHILMERKADLAKPCDKIGNKVWRNDVVSFLEKKQDSIVFPKRCWAMIELSWLPSVGSTLQPMCPRRLGTNMASTVDMELRTFRIKKVKKYCKC